VATILCVPTAKLLVEKVALPLLRATVARVELTLLKVSVKVIKPVGVPLPELGVTVAVKVIA
jgi:hypothetical protein